MTSTCSEVLPVWTLAGGLWNGVEPFCLRGQIASEKSYYSNCSPPVSLPESLIKPHNTEIKESVSQDIIQGSKLAFIRHLRYLMQIRQWERKLILFSLCPLEKVACDTWLRSFKAVYARGSVYAITGLEMIMWSGKRTGFNDWELPDRSVWVEHSIWRIPKEGPFRNPCFPKNDTETSPY